MATTVKFTSASSKLSKKFAAKQELEDLADQLKQNAGAALVDNPGDFYAAASTVMRGWRKGRGISDEEAIIELGVVFKEIEKVDDFNKAMEELKYFHLVIRDGQSTAPSPGQQAASHVGQTAAQPANQMAAEIKYGIVISILAKKFKKKAELDELAVHLEREPGTEFVNTSAGLIEEAKNEMREWRKGKDMKDNQALAELRVVFVRMGKIEDFNKAIEEARSQLALSGSTGSY